MTPTPPPIDEDEVVRLYKEGKGVRLIARALGVTTPERIRVILHRRDDVVVRQPGQAPWVNCNPSAAGVKLRSHLAEAGLSHAETARRVGISPKHLSQMLTGVVSIRVDIAAQLEMETGIDGRALLHLQTDEQYDHASKALKEYG
jgi:plasmid maintenance system antidote protein VapI